MASWKKVIVSGSNAVLAEVTASVGFSGDGSGLTGITATSVNIDGLDALGGTGLHQTQDHFMFSDNGTEKKITFSNLQDAVFADVSGDVAIAAGGAATIQADSVENSMLANIARGSVKVGGGSNAPTDLDAKTSGQILVGDGTDINSVAVSGDVSLASNGAVTIAADAVENSMLANMTRGTVKVGGGSNAPTDLDAKTSGQILVGDGTDIASVAVSGDVGLASNGAMTIQANAVEGSMLNSNVAGTGLDYGSNELSVDVSDFMTNGANNRIVTATGTDGMNGEANLTYDGTILSITGNVTASAGFTGSFVGDGSGLTGVTGTVDVDSLSDYGAQTLHQSQDHFLVSDNGTEKKINFSDLEDSIFANVSGDATIAGGGALTIAADSVSNSMLENMTRGTIKVGGGSNAPTDLDAKTSGQILVGDGTDIASVAVSGDIALASNGAMTIQANSVALGTDTTGNYVGTITGGDGISSTGATSGEGIGHTLSVDLSGLSSVPIGASTSEVTIGDNLTITGNLTVNGDQTIVSTTNLSVEDKFITLASGSTAGTDGGIIVQNAASGLGASFVWDTGIDRWALGKEGSLDDSASSVDVTAAGGLYNYVVGVSGSNADPASPTANPTFGANDASRAGQMHVNYLSGDIFIYS